eukprot:5812901-Amphidinium_carterae.2
MSPEEREKRGMPPPTDTTSKAAPRGPPGQSPPPKGPLVKPPSRGKTPKPEDKMDGAMVCKTNNITEATEFDLLHVPGIKFRKEPTAYLGAIQANTSSPEVRSLHEAEAWVHQENSASDQWYNRAQYIMGESGCRSMMPVPDALLATLASLHRDQARSLFSKLTKDGKHVTD